MVKDLNPLNTPNDILTDCVNGTLVTFNGNEFTLQNDMGNCKLDYGFLKSDYVPVGMKEYGGIIYVVSYNPNTNMTEVGSFPAPERFFTLDEESLGQVQGIAVDVTNSDSSIVFNPDFMTNREYPTSTSPSVVLSPNKPLSPGDEYCITYKVSANPITGATVSTDISDLLNIYDFKVFNTYEDGSMQEIAEEDLHISKTGGDFGFIKSNSTTVLTAVLSLKDLTMFNINAFETSNEYSDAKSLRLETFVMAEGSGIHYSGMEYSIVLKQDDAVMETLTGFWERKLYDETVNLNENSTFDVTGIPKEYNSVEITVTPTSKYFRHSHLQRTSTIELTGNLSVEANDLNTIFKYYVDDNEVKVDFDLNLKSAAGLSLYCEVYDMWSDVSTIYTQENPNAFGLNTVTFDIQDWERTIDTANSKNGIPFSNIRKYDNDTAGIYKLIFPKNDGGVDVLLDESLRRGHFYIFRICAVVGDKYYDVYRPLITSTQFNEEYIKGQVKNFATLQSKFKNSDLTGTLNAGEISWSEIEETLETNIQPDPGEKYVPTDAADGLTKLFYYYEPASETTNYTPLPTGLYSNKTYKSKIVDDSGNEGISVTPSIVTPDNLYGLVSATVSDTAQITIDGTDSVVVPEKASTETQLKYQVSGGKLKGEFVTKRKNIWTDIYRTEDVVSRHGDLPLINFTGGRDFQSWKAGNVSNVYNTNNSTSRTYAHINGRKDHYDRAKDSRSCSLNMIDSYANRDLMLINFETSRTQQMLIESSNKSAWSDNFQFAFNSGLESLIDARGKGFLFVNTTTNNEAVTGDSNGSGSKYAVLLRDANYDFNVFPDYQNDVERLLSDIRLSTHSLIPFNKWSFNSELKSGYVSSSVELDNVSMQFSNMKLAHCILKNEATLIPIEYNDINALIENSILLAETSYAMQIENENTLIELDNNVVTSVANDLSVSTDAGIEYSCAKEYQYDADSRRNSPSSSSPTSAMNTAIQNNEGPRANPNVFYSEGGAYDTLATCFRVVNNSATVDPNSRNSIYFDIPQQDLYLTGNNFRFSNDLESTSEKFKTWSFASQVIPVKAACTNPET